MPFVPRPAPSPSIPACFCLPLRLQHTVALPALLVYGITPCLQWNSIAPYSHVPPVRAPGAQVVEAHRIINCTTAPGAGANLVWRLTIDGLTSQSPVTSYAPPAVSTLRMTRVRMGDLLVPPVDPALSLSTLSTEGGETVRYAGEAWRVSFGSKSASASATCSSTPPLTPTPVVPRLTPCFVVRRLPPCYALCRTRPKLDQLDIYYVFMRCSSASFVGSFHAHCAPWRCVLALLAPGSWASTLGRTNPRASWMACG
jgi:hypothetical protein